MTCHVVLQTISLTLWRAAAVEMSVGCERHQLVRCPWLASAAHPEHTLGHVLVSPAKTQHLVLGAATPADAAAPVAASSTARLGTYMSST